MRKLVYILLVLFVIISFQETFAQAPPPPDGGGGDGNVDDVPVNFIVYPLTLLAIYLGLRFSLKKK